MKRCSTDEFDARGGGPPAAPQAEKIKRPRSAGGVPEPEAPGEEEEAAATASAELGEDLVLEVLKRADARTVGRAACVCRRWRRLAEDERLWEAVCTRDWVRIPYGKQQLRAVVLALGGFRRLHSLYILPFLSPSAPRPAAAAPPPALPLTAAAAALPRRPHPRARWGKDEVQLSLSLLSIGFFEKLNANSNRGGGGRGGGDCG